MFVKSPCGRQLRRSPNDFGPQEADPQLVQQRRSPIRLVFGLVAVLVVAILGLAVLARAGEPRSRVMPKAATAVLEVERAIESCAAERTDGRYQGGAGRDCLAFDALAAREPALASIRTAGLRVQITSVDAGAGYVAQVGTSGKSASWFAVARDSSGEVWRACSNEPIVTLRAGDDADAHGCEDGRWKNPRAA
jgi:hypothetical protein